MLRRLVELDLSSGFECVELHDMVSGDGMRGKGVLLALQDPIKLTIRIEGE